MITKHRPLFTHPNRKLRKPKKHPERDLQCDCVYWFRKTHKNQLIFSCPNEFARSEAAAARKMGLLRGVSDIIVVMPNRVLFIEFKSADGSQSLDQKRFQQKIERMGYTYAVIRTIKEFKDLINDTV